MARTKQNKKQVKIDKYSKVKPKVHPYTIASIVGFFVLVFALILVFQPSKQTLIYRAYTATMVEARTEGLTADNPFKPVSSYKGSLFNKGLEKILADDDIVILYIGTPNCSSCVSHIGAFQSYYESRGIDQFVKHIYYYNPAEDLDGFAKLQAEYAEINNQTPQLIAFKNGEIIETWQVLSSTNITEMNRSVRDFYVAVKAKLTA